VHDPWIRRIEFADRGILDPQGAVNCPAAVSPHVQVASDIRNGGGRRDGSDGRLWLASKSSRPNV
jgi:hypothetical protein